MACATTHHGTRRSSAAGLLVVMHQLVVARAVALALSRDTRIRIAAVTDSHAGAISAVSSIEPDVALCDGAMPGIAELIRQIRHNSLATAPLVLGSPDLSRPVTEYFDAGAVGFVAADATLGDAVTAIVAIAFGSKAVLSPTSSVVLAPTPVGNWIRRGVADLTPRESQICAMVANGMTNDEIAARLMISRATVKQHVHSMMRKLGVSRRSQVPSHYRTVDAHEDGSAMAAEPRAE